LRWFKCYTLALTLFAAFVAAPSGAQSTQMIRLGTQEWSPYQMLDNGQIVGVAMERVTCALERMGQAHEILLMDWSKAQLMTQNHELEGFFVGAPNAARARYATASEPVITEYRAWFMLRGRSINPESEADKVRARYGTKFATSQWLQLRREGYNVVKKPRDAEALLDMLLKGDIDVAFEYEMIFAHYMRERGLQESDIKKVTNQPQSNMVHFSNTFLASNTQFLQRFNSALGMCKGGNQ
jgi:polar amino acid transport system substrate-binding protein